MRDYEWKKRDITQEDGHTCYNQCGQCSECKPHPGAKKSAVSRMDCVSDNKKAKFYQARVDFNYDTSRCPGFIDSPDNIKFRSEVVVETGAKRYGLPANARERRLRKVLEKGLDDVAQGKVSDVDLKSL
jgi:hypothetical protein